MRALTPSNIVAGFRKCGVHPFNRNAIMNLDSAVTNSSKDTLSTSNNSPTNPADVAGAIVAKSSPINALVSRSTPPTIVTKLPVTNNTHSDVSLPPEKLELFERRYEGGYDIPDAEYEAWLKMAHPQAGITSVADTFQDVSILNPVGDSDDEILAYDTPVNSPEMFSPPASPSYVSSSADDNDVSVIAQSQTSEKSFSYRTSAPDKVTEVTSHASTSYTSVSSSTTPSQCNSSMSTEVSPLDKYLTLPDATPKSRTKTPEASKMRAMTGARVLTSAECFAIIKEQEQKKKQQEEEKIRKKKEREEKKQHKIEEQKKKLNRRLRKRKKQHARQKKSSEKSKENKLRKNKSRRRRENPRM